MLERKIICLKAGNKQFEGDKYILSFSSLMFIEINHKKNLLFLKITEHKSRSYRPSMLLPES